jgi:ribosomal protein S18 acetylase RimI-like enzyme
VIREAAPTDARAIADVHVASWRWAYRGQLSDDLLDGLSVEEREAMWRRGLERDDVPRTFVAERDGAVVGFVSVGPPEDAGAPVGTGELYAIYLLEDAAGLGVGRALFATGEQALRDAGYERAFLWVLASNERARRFYERAGWTWDGTTSEHRIDCANHAVVRYVRDLD